MTAALAISGQSFNRVDPRSLRLTRPAPTDGPSSGAKPSEQGTTVSPAVGKEGGGPDLAAATRTMAQSIRAIAALMEDPEVVKYSNEIFERTLNVPRDGAAAVGAEAAPAPSHPQPLADKLAALADAARTYRQAGADGRKAADALFEQARNLPVDQFVRGKVYGGPDPADARRMAALMSFRA